MKKKEYLKDPFSAWQEISNMTSSFQRRLNETLDRRMQGPIPPNAILTVTFAKSLTRWQLRCIAIASWSWGDAGIVLREELRDFLNEQKRLDDDSRLALLSREGADVVLRSLTDRDYHGNVKPLLERVAKNNIVHVTLKRQPRARRKVRRRGYRDHGTLRPDRQYRTEERKDEVLRELQIQEEEKARVHETLFSTFWGWADPLAHSTSEKLVSPG
jgi:hypothetical protein